MNALINALDCRLSYCKKYADSYSLRRTYFDNAFGMVQMFVALYPNENSKASKLWEEVYKPQFEALLWGE